jgi:H(+)-translocating pyrophosphatase
MTFLQEEYTYISIFCIFFAAVICFTVEKEIGQFWTVIPFLLGAITSIVSGYIGMMIAVKANVRTCKQATIGLHEAFVVAFRGGAVLGFTLVGLALLVLVLLIISYKNVYLTGISDIKDMFEAIAGYGLGGSTIALFGRVGGGIFTKAADVGADLVGKVVHGLDEDSIQNPGVIADNVGDNVGDIAGMGSDLFGSFAESTCACLVISATSSELVRDKALYFPLLISAFGIIVCIITSFLSTHVMTMDKKEKVEQTLKYQLVVSTILMTPVLYFLALTSLPDYFTF